MTLKFLYVMRQRYTRAPLPATTVIKSVAVVCRWRHFRSAAVVTAAIRHYDIVELQRLQNLHVSSE
jgi:hypothetical protein